MELADLKNVILIKQGDSSIIASPLDYKNIELYNKSKLVIHVLRCKIFDIKGLLLKVIPVDRLLQPSKKSSDYQEEVCTAVIGLDINSSSYVIWVFEYDNIQYHVKASIDINENDFEICRLDDSKSF